jgi:tRNA 2-thiouridine synthesizing protein A
MAEEMKADLDLDLKGLLCPMPMVRVSQNIGKVPMGGILKATASDPGSLADIPSWARTAGHEVVKSEKEGKNFVFYIKRLK